VKSRNHSRLGMWPGDGSRGMHVLSEDWNRNWRITPRVVDGTGCGSCPMAGFGISGVEPSGSATIELFN
jgi:hypothetical protein